ncbi:hypothetical protein HZS_4729 [Henneguya salminicola]|nr:hypothetical protein HZS_4729 [Henneguya salminicola]
MDYDGHTFIDDTFRSVPVLLTQCLIIMVQDVGTEFLLPQRTVCLLGRTGTYIVTFCTKLSFSWNGNECSELSLLILSIL